MGLAITSPDNCWQYKPRILHQAELLLLKTVWLLSKTLNCQKYKISLISFQNRVQRLDMALSTKLENG